MTTCSGTPPCPPVTPGDAHSHLQRARWILEYGQKTRQTAEPDLRHAIALDPTLWEPWLVLGEAAWDDAALQLHCYEEAIRRGARPVVKRKRARLLLLLDRFADAEQALTSIIERKDTTSFFLAMTREERAGARVHR